MKVNVTVKAREKTSYKNGWSIVYFSFQSIVEFTLSPLSPALVFLHPSDDSNLIHLLYTT